MPEIQIFMENIFFFFLLW